jgi:hypothetical protein
VSTSLYFQASRAKPIRPAEQKAIDRLVNEYVRLVKKEWAKRNWRSFDVHPPALRSTPGAIFEGSAQLPDASAEVMWIALQHWASLLSQIRLVLPGAKWHVNVDDHSLRWDPKARAWDPSR